MLFRSVNPQTGQWMCHSTCGRGGSVYDLEMELSGKNFKDAVREVHSIIGRPAAQKPQIAKTYDYTDESGKLLFQAVRYEPKAFKQRRPDGHGEWIWELKGVRLVLYRLPELTRRALEPIFLCEGEKDVETLEALGLLATTNPMGAGKWRPEYSEQIRGRSLVCLPDNDPPTDENGKPHYKGQKHMAAVAADLMRVGCEVRFVELAEGKDISDWVAAGGTVEELQSITGRQPVLFDETLTALRARWQPAAENEQHRAALAQVADGWPKLEPLQSELPPVEAFSEELLLPSFRPLVRDVSERMQVPMDYPAVVILLCLAGAVNRRATIQPKAQDTGWVVVPNLWGGIIAPPGFMKSPSFKQRPVPWFRFRLNGGKHMKKR